MRNTHKHLESFSLKVKSNVEYIDSGEENYIKILFPNFYIVIQRLWLMERKALKTKSPAAVCEVTNFILELGVENSMMKDIF